MPIPSIVADTHSYSCAVLVSCITVFSLMITLTPSEWFRCICWRISEDTQASQGTGAQDLNNVYWTKKLSWPRFRVTPVLFSLLHFKKKSSFSLFLSGWVLGQLSHSVTAHVRVKLRTLTPAVRVVRVLLAISLCMVSFATLLFCSTHRRVTAS